MALELFGEFLGTFILILLGNGVVANVNLNKSYGNGGGWIVITAGWGMAVYVAVLATADLSGAHINPAVTIGLALAGLFDWIKVIPFILAQMAGAMLGASAVYLFFRNHFRITETAGMKKSAFCTAPAVRDTPNNLFSEFIGTFILILAVLLISLPQLEYESLGSGHVGLGSLGALPVALVVFSIGMSLGGTTGYAINPARDLGPRIVHTLLPMKNKDDNDWRYAWVPIMGPIAGAAFAALVYLFILQLCNC
ncbi:aquaporin family protein [Prolixibacteraceae bacterium Z1-6]|uniref:Aquaporin family protein n=1 Tax=Draconibacterium aestuarii TaxID=2998507 RepID=A0A9X3J7F5_9BACT|nr:aquaporin family protein [Prolixibacteraceae bacterium Z1-6]